jgi:ADP-ribose pyrophosphatase
VTNVFLYGTLCDIGLLGLVLGRTPDPVAARLAGARVVWADGESFPLLVDAPGAETSGLLLSGLTASEVARLDFYEAGFGYDLVPVTVSAADGPVEALVYRCRDGLWRPGAPWSLDRWQAGWGPVAREAAPEFMALMATKTAGQAARSYGPIRMRAASRLRARAEARGRGIRAGAGAGGVEARARRVPYSEFFAVEEWDLRFRRFDGQPSPEVTRAAFLSADAVTVLPYDPRRDRVLLVEQFRFGPMLRGDPMPWSLEPIAGRVDPGETPEDCARREAVEEAGLEIGQLIPVGRYYPSPGAMTEYLYSFIGLADLPDSAAGLGGLASEAEDIRAHLLGFADLMALCERGEAENGPLLLSALALERQRARLRG